MKVKKHDGRLESFEPWKIKKAVMAAGASKKTACEITQTMVERMRGLEKEADAEGICSVDAIHNAVEVELMKREPAIAKSYILYRQKRADYRESESPLNKEIEKYYAEINRDNANAANGSAASKMYSIAEAATKNYNLSKMSKRAAWNHRKGRIYIHDLAYRNITFNCFFNPIGRMLKEGFGNGVGYIRLPKRIGSALALVAIILQSSQNSLFGGQGILNFDTDLAPYVKAEYHRQYERLVDYQMCGSRRNREAMEATEKEVYQAMEAFVYNMNQMRSRSGAQPTFSSVNFGTDTSWAGRMITRNLLKAYISGLGHGENPIFPNLCYRLKEGVNLRELDPNFDLTKLAIECVGKRIQPRFVFCDSYAYAGLELNEIGAMGCRTSIRANVNGEKTPEARGNLAFVTINLPYLALEAKGDAEKFASLLKEALNDAKEELLDRYKTIKQLKKRDIPFVSDWYQGAAGLKEDDEIEPMIKNGTLSIGFIGLAECLKVLYGKHQGESDKVNKEGLALVATIRGFTNEATKETSLNFSTFASPAESACYTLMKACRRDFGVIEGVTDKEYLTNSFHLPVDFECDAKKKIDIEGRYHLLCNAGAIFYLESEESPKNNPEGLLSLLQYMSESGIAYGGVNWKHAFCEDCHEQGDFRGTCPKCGSKNIKETAIITGYLSEKDRFNDGKLAELRARKGHLGGGLNESSGSAGNVAV